MPKEILLYSPIYDFVAERIITAMEQNKDQDITLRINSPGGEVFAGWGLIAKIKEHPGNIIVKVDGAAASMASDILLFVSYVEALDVTRFLLHRADMPIRDEKDQEFLDGVNKDLKSKMTSKLDSAKLKELKGVSIEDLFKADGERVDLWLTAKEAKAIGLVNKIVKLETAQVKAMEDRHVLAFEETQRYFSIAATAPSEPPKPTNNDRMTIDELKAKHPDVYALAVADGAAQERDRVGAWMAFAGIDPEAVKKGIESKEPVTQRVMAEMGVKAMSPDILAKLTKEAAPAVVTETPAAANVKPEVLAFEQALNTRLGIKAA